MLLSDPQNRGADRRRDWRLRLAVWWRRGSIDRELAAGAPPASRADLRLRAEQLTAADNRRRLAAVIHNLLDAADEPPNVLEQQAPGRAINRAAVAAVRDELVALAAWLTGPERIPPQTIARASLLAFNETGPLYGADPRGATTACSAAMNGILGRAVPAFDPHDSQPGRGS